MPRALRSTQQFDPAKNPSIQHPRSSFHWEEKHTTTFNHGELIPIYCDTDILPGDTWQIKSNYLMRFATLLFPLMDNIVAEEHWYFIPNRLLWDSAEGSWERFMGEQVDPGDSIDLETPVVTINTGSGTGLGTGSLYDYFGLPIKKDDIEVVNFAGRAYNLIYNEWYRPQDIIDSLVVDKDNGPDTLTDYVIRARCKYHDYFTTALPYPQKGAVPVALQTTVVLTNDTGTGAQLGAGLPRKVTDSSLVLTQADLGTDGSGQWVAADNTTALVYDPNTTLVTNVNINELRESFAIQQLLEIDSRSGTRYGEVIYGHFGVTNPDMRLMRPEFLGGSRFNLIVTPIAQQSQTSGSAALGDLAGMATASRNGGGFPTKSFTEHGVLMCILSTRADLTYTQGIPRAFSRRTRYQYYLPVLSNIGEQAILNQEIFATEVAGDNDNVFGYAPRWDEYRRRYSKMSGLMRPDATSTLSAWNLSEDFAATPTLSDEFIKENAPISRVITVTSEPHFICDSLFECHAVRPMPMFGRPGLDRL